MKLSELTKNIDILNSFGELDREIRELTYHSGQVQPHGIFVAVKGQQADGHKFIAQAIQAGASVVVTEKKVQVSEEVTNLVVADTRKTLAQLSANFFGDPSRHIALIGVTGTNGKTTTTYLLEAIFEQANFNPGVIGTIEHRFGKNRLPAKNTTPESYDLQKLLRQMLDQQINVCVMEVSSHALMMERVTGCHFDGAIFTNLTPEHLDFHQEMDAYFSAKTKLFQENLAQSKKKNTFAAINIDDPYGQRLLGQSNYKIIKYALTNQADVRATEIKAGAQGISLKIATPNGSFSCVSKLLGKFNVHNILAATSTAIGLGLPLEIIGQGLAKVRAIPGRFEQVLNEKGILVFVDYAHTPDALRNVLMQAKELLTGNSKLICVFGCGGDRDKQKRPAMGAIASKYADRVLITNDNPRTEDPAMIIKDIIVGVKGANFEIIEAREQAIKAAVEMAKEGDVIVVAGKGHEDYQIIGTTRRHFDDREVLREYLQ
ncbi:MAG: UDP-N-acetylmuramoyl-L-alanyl-D-glutamate--2,6-diaminopimelate ligase [Pseudomonadota bacterium]